MTKEVCALEYRLSPAGEVEVRVSVLDPSYLGKQVQFYIEVEADVVGPEVPVHARRVLFSIDFELRETMQPIEVPIRSLEMYLYQGELITIRLYGTLAINAKPVLEQAIELDGLRLETLKPSCVAEIQNSIEIADPNTIGAISESVSQALSRYADISMVPISDAAREQRKIRVGDLFEAETRFDLEDLTFQLVAWNTEYAQHEQINSHLETQITTFARFTREIIVFEKRLPKVVKGEAIQNLVDEILDFSELFSAHCPPLKVTEFHGIGFRMEARLVHPERHTTHSECLAHDIWDEGPKDFMFEDLLKPHDGEKP